MDLHYLEHFVNSFTQRSSEEHPFNNHSPVLSFLSPLGRIVPKLIVCSCVSFYEKNVNLQM